MTMPELSDDAAWWSASVAVVTGAGSGIGQGIARVLAARGAQVFIADRDYDSANLAAEELRAKGSRATPVKCDVSMVEEVNALVDDAVAAGGRLDILVNCAGVSRPNMLWNVTDEQWDEVIRTNLSSQFWAIRAAVNAWMKDNGGAIVNISSLAGLRGSVAQVNYAAAKSGVIGVTKSAALDLARFNIRVNAVAPGLTLTNMTRKIMDDPKLRQRYEGEIPLGRIGTPEDIAHAVAFLASPQASWITGKVLAVDGGAYN
jgi:3-oxoacyl-[acyl-carrier protein] reductase